MASDDSDDFHIRTGRSRGRGSRASGRGRSFVGQVQAAVRKAGGNPKRIGASVGKGTGRFNARGRGAKLVASFARDGGKWRSDSAGRFRSRRVMVKARVVKLNPQRGAALSPKMRAATRQAADAHLRYLTRDGVTRDGEKGRPYSALEDETDGRAFLERGREDRHQFRFIVAPEDASELGDLRAFTRDLMRQVERDLETRLDWIAVDHHNTGHPHSHILVRGVTDEGKTLNIAGDYIANGIRHRASEFVTRELGHQSEIEVARKLASEVKSERLTRLDKILLAEQEEQGLVDLRPGQGHSYLVRDNRHLLIDRARRLERFGLATETDPGRWAIDEKAETVLKELGERGDAIKTLHRALAEHGLAEARDVGDYALHGTKAREPVVGRVLAKGLADELGEKIYLVVDGVDGRVHRLEFSDPARVEEVGPGMIVKAEPPASGPRASDRNIESVAEEGVYRPSRHLEHIRESFERQGKDPEAFVRFHVRRLEALRRAGHVERLDEDHWRVPNNLTQRGRAYDFAREGGEISVRTLSTLDLERQVGSDGATWLDRELAGQNGTPIKTAGFGRDVAEAMERRKQRHVDMGQASFRPDGAFVPSKSLIADLERQEVERVGQEMAKARGLTFQQAKPGEYVSGELLGSTQLASGRYAMLDTGLGFSLVPWQPVLNQRIGQQIAGVMRAGGGVEWDFARKRGLGM